MPSKILKLFICTYATPIAFLYKKLTHQTDGLTAVATVVARRVEAVRIEVELVRVARVVRRSRPVVTGRTDIVHIRAIAVARSRQEDGTRGFHYFPLFCGVGIVREVSAIFVVIFRALVCQTLGGAG